MKTINAILNNSQNILNNMKETDEESIHSIKNNQLKLEKIIMELNEKSVYEKYIKIHTVILESAQEFFHTNHEIYKLQPLLYYLKKDDFKIQDNSLRIAIKDKEVILNKDSKTIEIQDEFHLENDSLFEKENIPFLIKDIARERDFDKLQLLENYVTSLITQAEEEIEKT